jgi:S-formylglutathione hydrolase FrmB
MKSPCLFPLVVLVMLLPTAARAEEQIARVAFSKPDELPWVTRQVEAPRVSFHTFRSHAANSEVSYHVYRPAAYEHSAGGRFPVLYWLHGTEGGVNHIRPVAEMFDRAIGDKGAPPMIVVFVNGLPKRLWTNSKDGRAPIETVFIDELIPEVDRTYRTIPRREGRILEGFSMGGYGAARIGFRHLEMFCGISILAAGPLDPAFEGPRATGNPLRDKILEDVCEGDMGYFKAMHPWTLAESCAVMLRKPGTLIRQAVGSKDFSFDLNRRFHEHLDALRIPHEFHVVKDVGHRPPALMAGLENANFYRQALGQKAAETGIKPINAEGLQ